MIPGPLLYLGGMFTGIVSTLAYQQAREASRAATRLEALRGNPPMRNRR